MFLYNLTILTYWLSKKLLMRSLGKLFHFIARKGERIEVTAEHDLKCTRRDAPRGGGKTEWVGYLTYSGGV